MNFNKAEKYCQQIDQGSAISAEMPMAVMLHIASVDMMAKFSKPAEGFNPFSAFKELDAISFFRYRNCFFFKTGGSDDFPIGYLFYSGKEFAKLPLLTDHYMVLSEKDRSPNWKEVELEYAIEDD